MRIKQFNFFSWLSNVKNLVLSNGSATSWRDRPDARKFTPVFLRPGTSWRPNSNPNTLPNPNVRMSMASEFPGEKSRVRSVASGCPVSFQMALNMCEMWFNGIKIAFFPKNYKKSPNSWGLRPQTPVCDTFELHWFSENVSKVTHLHFSTILVEALSLCKILVKCQQANFWWRHCMWFVV